MTIAPENIDLILPCGESLRSFVEQPFITKGDLKSSLRTRGIFVYSSDKEETIPIATCCLFSPKEFDQLKECQISREDNPKKFSQILDWNGTHKLLEAVPTDINFAQLLGEAYGYCKMVGTPQFVPVGNDRDKIQMNFQIERKDYSKSWATSLNTYKGSIRLEKISDGKSVKLLFTYTADETKQFNQAIAKSLTKHFKAKNYVAATAEVRRILFTDFSNEQRIAFFWSLTGASGLPGLEFKDVPDIGVCPDPACTDLPSEIKWMEKRVADLKLKGSSLHETFFIKEEKFHEYLLLYSMDIRFKFSYQGASGVCLISFEFMDFSTETLGVFEFESKVVSLTLDPQYEHVNKGLVKEYVLNLAEAFAYEQYQKICETGVVPLG